jgi:ElaB/YqjD/DUF883 family membrane-anchored ribosome-binding protein
MTTAIRHHNRTHTHSDQDPGHNDHRAHHSHVVEEANGLLDRLTLSNISDEAKELVHRLRENVASLKESATVAQKQIEAGLHTAEKQIKQNPWMAVGITSAVGILIGYLLGRHRS